MISGDLSETVVPLTASTATSSYSPDVAARRYERAATMPVADVTERVAGLTPEPAADMSVVFGLVSTVAEPVVADSAVEVSSA